MPPPVGGDGPHAYKILLRSRPEEAKSHNKKENHQSFRDVQIEKDEEATKTSAFLRWVYMCIYVFVCERDERVCERECVCV